MRSEIQEIQLEIELLTNRNSLVMREFEDWLNDQHKAFVIGHQYFTAVDILRSNVRAYRREFELWREHRLQMFGEMKKKLMQG